MSFDLKIQNICDHKILLEKAGLEADQKTVKPKSYIANTSFLEVYRFGNLVDRSFYSVVEDLEFGFIHKKSKILFLKKEVHKVPFYEISYQTMDTDCPKCSGTKYSDDLSFDEKGGYKVVTSEALLAQNVEKYIVTQLASNSFHPWLGTKLTDLIGTKVLDINLIKVQIKEEITKAFSKLSDLQKQHLSTSQEVTLGERVDKLISVESVQDLSDPSIFTVTVKYMSKSGKALSLQQSIELLQFRQRSAF
jgi:hypothetical protein